MQEAYLGPTVMAKLEWTPHFTILHLILLYIINKFFFTLLSITTKWINLYIKKFIRLFLYKIALDLTPQQLFCTKAIYTSGSRGKT